MLSIALVLACLGAYLCGSLSSAVLVCKFRGLPDPRTQGSQNPGATNVLRIGGKGPALLTLAGDVLKGFIPVLVAKYYGFDLLALAIVALSAFLGHLYPLFFRFKGGKGAATFLGTLTALSWPLGLSLIFTWIGIALTFRYSSLAALIMTLFAPFYAWHFIGTRPALIIGLMGILLIIRHRQNIGKLIAGKESRIGNT